MCRGGKRQAINNRIQYNPISTYIREFRSPLVAQFQAYATYNGNTRPPPTGIHPELPEHVRIVTSTRASAPHEQHQRLRPN